MSDPIESNEGAEAGSSPVACSPPQYIIDLHRNLQKMRPIFAAGGNDPDAVRGLEQCDAAMIAADMTYPDFDFYAENECSPQAELP